MKLFLIYLALCVVIVNCDQQTSWSQIKNYFQTFLKIQNQQNALENESLLAYNVDGALAWANSCCAGTGCSECRCVAGGGTWCTSTGCACAEFVSRALIKGGLGIPVIVNTFTLRDALENKGWHSVSSVQAGDAVFYNEPNDPLGHVCLGVGDGIVDCHNINQCSAGAQYQGSIALILRA